VKAARLHEFGEPLRIDEIPIPKVGENDVLVKMAASYVCNSDLHLIEGKIQPLNLPLTLGHCNAGYVEKVGSNITDLKNTGSCFWWLGLWSLSFLPARRRTTLQFV
jgi:propanol-preferring alcohol dehydrogenase